MEGTENMQNMPKKKKRGLVGRIFGWLGATVALAVIVFVVWFIIGMQPAGRDEEKRAFVVEAGQNLETVGTNLENAGLVKNGLVFTLVAMVTGKGVQAGVHYLAPSQNVMQVAYELQKTAGVNQIQVTILAGQTLAELKEKLVKSGFAADGVEAAFNRSYDSPILADKPAGATLEGYIFPDTYFLDADSDVAVLVEMALDNLYEKMRSDGSLERLRTQGRSVFETLTMASIVQKEVSDPEEQKMVAGVFENRLQWGMVLGSDVTFHYAYKQGYCAVNSPDCDSVYNTRVYKGLPPGPIANMEYAAIQAVLQPTESEYFFFVAGDDGRTYYAVDENGHFENVRNYCHVLCQ